MSSDGTTIYLTVFSKYPIQPDTTSDVYSMHIDSGELSAITHGGALVHDLPWISRDNRSIVYISTLAGEKWPHVWIMGRDGGNARQLTFGAVVDSNPSYSHDGKKIVFARSAEFRAYSMGGTINDQWDIWEMNADGFSLRQLTFEKYYIIDAPYFSPDDKHVLFAAASPVRSDLNHNLWMCDVQDDGSVANLRIIPLSAASQGRDYDGQPSFSPDGSTIVFVAWSDNGTKRGYEIFMANVDGSNMRQISYEHSTIYDPIISPDGRYIYYSMQGVWRMGIDGSNPTLLTQ